MNKILLCGLIIFTASAHAATTLKCRTAPNQYIYTTASFCPSGSTLIDAQSGGIGEYQEPQYSGGVSRETRCQQLRNDKHWIQFRLSHNHSRADDFTNLRKVEFQMAQLNCRPNN